MKKLNITTYLNIPLTLIAGVFLISSCTPNTLNPRTTENFDNNWQFILDDNADFSMINAANISWQNIHLRQNWYIKQSFNKKTEL